MVHRDLLVVALKVGGKILRENKDSVSLPFGSEYSVLIKNLDSKRIQVSVDIDGQNVTDGKLIVGPNSDLELERFIRNGNLDAGNRFKFIERTAQIEQHRGIDATDGIVRVESWSEVIRPVLPVPIVHYYNEYVPLPWYTYHRPSEYRPKKHGGGYGGSSYGRSGGGHGCSSGIFGSSGGGGGCSNNTMLSHRMPSSSDTRCSAGDVLRSANFVTTALNDTGITVAGSESHQKFVHVSDFETEAQSRVVVLHLRGAVGGKPVHQALTAKQKIPCPSCGTHNKSFHQFCVTCGTALRII